MAPSPHPLIVVVHPSNDWYGSDRMLIPLVGALRTEGRPVEVILPETGSPVTTRLEDALRRAGCSTKRACVPVLRRRELSLTGAVRFARSLLVFARAFRSSVPSGSVTILNTSALAPLSPVLRLLGYPTIGYLHEVPSPVEARLLGQMWRSSAGLIAISDAVRSAFSAGPQLPVRVVKNCSDRVDPVPMPPAPPIEFLFIGRLTPRKGVRELVECFAQLDAQRHRLTVMGGVAAKGATIDLPALRRSMREANVEYVGEVADPGPYIDACHVVVVPSLLPEGLGLTAVEALARARPVAATAVAGLTEVVDTAVGWLLDPHASETWAETIGAIDTDDVTQRGPACIARFQEYFSPEAYRRELLASLRQFGVTA